jgi:hypothetical protein
MVAGSSGLGTWWPAAAREEAPCQLRFGAFIAKCRHLKNLCKTKKTVVNIINERYIENCKYTLRKYGETKDSIFTPISLQLHLTV